MKPADVMDFFRKSKNAKVSKQDSSRNSIHTLLRFGEMKACSLLIRERTISISQP
jgi:hypothetical protein